MPGRIQVGITHIPMAFAAAPILKKSTRDAIRKLLRK